RPQGLCFRLVTQLEDTSAPRSDQPLHWKAITDALEYRNCSDQARALSVAATAICRRGARDARRYAIVSRQTAPTVSWLQTARDELVWIYEATHPESGAAMTRRGA